MLVTYESDWVLERLLHEHIAAHHGVIRLKFVILKRLPVTIVAIDRSSTQRNIVSESCIGDGKSLF